MKFIAEESKAGRPPSDSGDLYLAGARLAKDWGFGAARTRLRTVQPSNPRRYALQMTGQVRLPNGTVNPNDPVRTRSTQPQKPGKHPALMKAIFMLMSEGMI